MRYFFDIHADSLSEWDDVGATATTIEDAVEHARYLLKVVFCDSDRLSRDRHATIMIRDSIGIPIATVTGQSGKEPRVVVSGEV